MLQKTPPQKKQSATKQTSPLVEILTRRQWNRLLQLTRGIENARDGSPQERCFFLLLRATAARDMHDRGTFEKSAAAYRRESARMTADQRTQLEQMVLQGKFVTSYQDPRYRMRPRAQMSVATLKQHGLSPTNLEALRRNAREAVTDALYLWHNDKIVIDDHFDAPQEPRILMSVTKVITAMAIGRLLDLGKLKSLDQLASDFFPEWKEDAKKQTITLRHLLTHTAGLSNGEDLSETAQAEMNRAAGHNILAAARAIRSETTPGSRWIYSNFGFVLLGDIVRQASGKRLDAFMQEAFFAPMRITEWAWITDPAGNIEAHGHLSLWAQDMAKFGILMIEGGLWKGRRLLSEAFVRESLRDQTQVNGVRVKDAPPMGLAWFLEMRDRNPRVVFGDRTAQEWRKLQISQANLAKMLPYKGKIMSEREFETLTRKLFGVKNIRDGEGWSRALGIIHYPPIAERVIPKLEDTIVTAFHHNGTGGQFLLCLPEKRFVAVRQTTYKDLSDLNKDSTFTSFNYEAAAVVDSRVFDADDLLLRG